MRIKDAMMPESLGHCVYCIGFCWSWFKYWP